jgi:nicotine blue oxidoreductase
MTAPRATPLPVTGILLAAGAGSRLHMGPKALLEMDGIPLAAHQAGELLAGGCARVIVVAGAGAERLESEVLPTGTEVAVNRSWHLGLSTSLRTGVAAVPWEHAVLVALVDQPGMGRDLVRRLLDAHSESSPGVVSAAYARPDGSRRRGHPLVMDPDVARQVAKSTAGDSGAREWLAGHPERLRLVDCDDLDDGSDIDTPEDLARWERAHPGRGLKQAH